MRAALEPSLAPSERGALQVWVEAAEYAACSEGAQSFKHCVC